MHTLVTGGLPHTHSTGEPDPVDIDRPSSRVDVDRAAPVRVSREPAGSTSGTAKAQALCDITAAVLAAVRSADHAGITVTERHRAKSGAPRRVRTQARTDVLRRLDELQTELQQGPCLTTLREPPNVSIADTEADQRWPAFAARATELGIRSVLSLPLLVEHDSLVTFNLYACTPNAFTDTDETIVRMLTTHVAEALQETDDWDHLSRTVARNAVIEQAKGVLMARDTLTDAQAFDQLSRTSRLTGIELADSACLLVTESAHPPTASRHNGTPTPLRRSGFPQGRLQTSVSQPTATTVVLHVTGDLDLLTAPSLWQALQPPLAGAPRRIVIDLTGVSFLGVAGLRMLGGIERYATAVGIGLRLVPGSHCAEHALRVSGLWSQFVCCPDLENATTG